MVQRSVDDRVGLTVLVADDDEELRAMVVLTLRGDGYVVVEARDGEEMLAVILGSATVPAIVPDVIIADVLMPKLSGLGVLAELRHAGLRLPIVMMTAFHPPSVEIVARRLGAAGVLKKPFALADLRSAVTNAHRAA